MGKLVISVLSLFLYLFLLPNLYAQEALNKGSYSISGSIQYSSSSSEDNFSSVFINNHTFHEHYLTFSPQFVAFVANHFSIGGLISYNYHDVSINSYSPQKKSNISLGALFRYYFFVEKYIPFLESSISINVADLETSNSNNLYGLGLKAGIAYFLSNSVDLEPSLSYNYSVYNIFEPTTNSPTTSVFSVSIGVNYFIF